MLFDEKNRGATLNAGDLFCQIGDPEDLEAVLIIDQGDVEFVKEGDSVQIKLDAYPDTTLESEIEEIAKIEMEATPPGVTVAAGGDLATRTDPTGRQRPLSTSYQARAPLDQPGDPMWIGMRGRAKVHTGWQTLASRLWRYMAKTFYFQL
jgi:putative peptide zinc metalloprotease protein